MVGNMAESSKSRHIRPATTYSVAFIGHHSLFKALDRLGGQWLENIQCSVIFPPWLELSVYLLVKKALFNLEFIFRKYWLARWIIKEPPWICTIRPPKYIHPCTLYLLPLCWYSKLADKYNWVKAIIQLHNINIKSIKIN